MASEWITTAEAAALSGYTPKHVRRLATSGAIAAQKFGRDWMIDRRALLAYVRQAGKWGEKRGPKPGA